MSALGQKQTYAVQNGMSALPPIATSLRFSACPLWTKRALMHRSKQRCLLDDLVRQRARSLSGTVRRANGQRLGLKEPSEGPNGIYGRGSVPPGLWSR